MGSPKDNYHLVYIILLLHGIGTLLPWNMFITANDYFTDYKLNVTINGNETNSASYRENFLQYVGIASKLPNVIIQGVNFLFQANQRSLTNRILVSIILEAIVFGVTTALTVINSSQWPGVFFSITMVSVVAINIANGVYQNCIFGAAAVLPMRFTNAVVTGMNISGIFASVLMIVSIAVAPDPQTAAFCYFTTAVIFLVICFVTYIILMKNPLIRHYNNEAINDSSQSMMLPRDSNRSKIDWTKYAHIAKSTWMQLFNVFFTLFVSLALFPAVLADIKPLDSLVSDKYFGPLFCFLSFNFFAMIGNLLASDGIPRVSPNRLWIPVVARLVFVPFFLFCNYQPGAVRQWSILFHSDIIYAVGVALMALSSGYLSSLAMIYAPKSVEVEHASTAGMMASFALMIGILVGVLSSFVLSVIVCH